jgi:integrase
VPRRAKELTALEVKRLERPGFHAVGNPPGLLHRITDTGAKGWVLRVSVAGKRRHYGLGSYPGVPLAEARERAREIMDRLWRGIDPIAEKNAADDARRTEEAKRLTFAKAARLCHDTKKDGFRNVKHRADWLRSLEMYAFPLIGDLPVSAIERAHVESVLEPIWKTKTETATRLRQRIESTLTWATVSGYREGPNPAQWRGNLEVTLAPPKKIQKRDHYPALPWQEMSAFMADLRQRAGVSARALEFLILTAARSGEVRKATWAEIDLGERVWTVPGEHMKSGRTHRVPLSDDAISLLRALPRLQGSDLVFTSPRSGMLSDMSVSAVCKRMGYAEPGTGRIIVPHGFRSSFKDWARSRTSYADEITELALAHVNSDATRAAYARDELLPQRARLMRAWAKYIRAPATSGEVIPMRHGKIRS